MCEFPLWLQVNSIEVHAVQNCQEKAIFYGAGSKVHALLRNHDFLEAFMVRAHYMQPQKPAVTEKRKELKTLSKH